MASANSRMYCKAPSSHPLFKRFEDSVLVAPVCIELVLQVLCCRLDHVLWMAHTMQDGAGSHGACTAQQFSQPQLRRYRQLTCVLVFQAMRLSFYAVEPPAQQRPFRVYRYRDAHARKNPNEHGPAGCAVRARHVCIHVVRTASWKSSFERLQSKNWRGVPTPSCCATNHWFQDVHKFKCIGLQPDQASMKAIVHRLK